MLENKKKRSVLSFLIILNFILIIICLFRIKFSYAKVEKYTNMASNEYKDDYKDWYDIKLDNPKNPILNRKDTKFNYYYDLIWKELEEYVTETNSLSKKN